MSHFSQEAVKLLRAAEDALSGRRPAQEELFGKRDGELNELRGSMPVLELQRQLRAAVAEINNLRSELTAERESRSQTIALLGRRWKEEMMVEIRASDCQSRRVISELEMRVEQQQKEEATARALMQRQLDDVGRGSKVRERSQFDQQEYMQQQLDGLRERLEAAVAECGLVRVESAQQLEKERASLAHRLDAELLRYVDMRRNDQREREALKQELKAEVAAFSHHVKDLVDEAWRTHVAALERTLREPIDSITRQIAQHDETVSGMDAKIHDCVTACRAEVRLNTAALQERVNALESTSAVTVSRVDRAERKADAAQETASRSDASVAVTRDTAERAVAQAQRAMERAQRMEDTVQDRDARLAQLETQLGAVATAEKLRAEIEGVRRAALRAESGVDALRQVCERDEKLAEHTRRVVDGYTDRIDGCEQLVHRLRAAVETVEGRVPQVQQRVAALEEAREGLVASATRVDDTVAQVGQRVQSAEGALKGISERLEHAQRDALSGLQGLATRLEYTSDMALRSETSSAAARAEVDRMSRRVCELEAQANRISVDCVTSRTAAEDHAKEAAALLSRLQQTREWQEQREARVDATISEVQAQITSALEQTSGRLESRLQRDVHRLQTTLEERAAAIKTFVEKEVAFLQEHTTKTQISSGDDDASQRLAREVQTCRAKIESLNTSLAAMSDTVEQSQKDYVLLRDWTALRQTVLALESKLHTTHADAVMQQQQTSDDLQVKLRHLEGEQRRQRLAVQELRESLNELRNEIQLTRPFSVSRAMPATKDHTPVDSAVATTASAATFAPITTTSKIEEVADKMVEEKVERVSFVELPEARVSDPRGSQILVSGDGTTTALALSAHSRSSSPDVIPKDDHNDPFDTQPVPLSQEGVDDLVQESSMATTLTTASRRFTTSRGGVTGEPPVMAWGGTVISRNPMRGTTSLERRSDAQPVCVTVPSTSTAASAAREVDGEEKNKGGVDRAHGAAGPINVMKPPYESSNSVESAEAATRQGHALSLRQHAESHASSEETNLSVVVPFFSAEKGVKSASVAPVESAVTTVTDAPPAPRNVAWYNDWDDSSTSGEENAAEGVRQDASAAAVVPFASSQQFSDGDEACALPRRTFVPFAAESPKEEAEKVVALRHGGATTTTTRSSSSSLLKKTMMADSAPKRFTSFDDTTSEDEGV